MSTTTTPLAASDHLDPNRELPIAPAQMDRPYTAFEDRERSLRQAELRNELIPARQRLADATATLARASRTLYVACADDRVPTERLRLLWQDLGDRLTEYDAATAAVARLDAELRR